MDRGAWWATVHEVAESQTLDLTTKQQLHICARGCTATLGNFAKDTFNPISKTYRYLTPIYGKRQCSPSLSTRNTLTIL